MLYELQQDIEMMFYFARIIALWVFFEKCILLIFNHNITLFNVLSGWFYLFLLCFDMEALRITIVMCIFIVNTLHLLSK